MMPREKKLFLLDMDGTLYLGDRLFDCTLPFLKKAKENGANYLFLTNNSLIRISISSFANKKTSMKKLTDYTILIKLAS